MPSNFVLQRSIPKWGKDTYVNWSKDLVKKAVVFIHGFNGSSMDTFGDFNLEFRYLPEYKDYDVYFYSYDSLYSQIENSALYFLDFLTAINTDIQRIIINSGSSITRVSPYTKVVIVAHSLGAVVTRLALNEGYDSNQNWLDKCELVLFAPAHQGAHPTFKDLLDIIGPFKILGTLFKYQVLTFNQLVDRTIIIEPMTEKVKNLIEHKNIKTFTIAKKVIWADPDRVVINRKFLKDPKADSFRFARKGHQAICKPSKKFTTPFDNVAEIL